MSTQNYTEHLKKNFFLAYPVMLSQLGHMMVGVADSVMVGRLGAVPLAGASLANVIFHITLMFGIGVSYAITPLVAAADGEGNVNKSADFLRHAIIINVVTGLLLFAIVKITNPALAHMNQPEDVVILAIPYLNIITFSLVPLLIFQTFRQFAEGLSDTKQAMIIVIGSNLVNVALNYVLIYGKLGFDAYGLLGAGYASFISRIILAAWMALYIYYGKRFSPYRLGFTIANYSKAIFKKMLGIGLPAGFQMIFEVSAFGCAVIMIGWLGAEALAAHQIAINLAAISYMMATGLSAAATVRVGNQLGLKDIPSLRAAAFTLYGMVIIFMGVCATLFIVGRYYLPSLYIENDNVIEIASTLLIIAGFFQISDGVQVLSLGALRGLEDVKIPTLMTFIAYWVLALPIGYTLGFVYDMGAEGVWYGLLIGLTIVAIFMFWRFNILTKRMLNT